MAMDTLNNAQHYFDSGKNFTISPESGHSVVKVIFSIPYPQVSHTEYQALGADGCRGDIALACLIPIRAISRPHQCDGRLASKPALHVTLSNWQLLLAFCPIESAGDPYEKIKRSRQEMILVSSGSRNAMVFADTRRAGR